MLLESAVSKLLKTTFCAILVLVLSMRVSASYADVDTLLPAYVRVVPQDAMPSDYVVDDSTFIHTAGKIIFPVNKSILDKKDPLVRELITRVMPLVRTEGWEFAGMSLRGAASPDGSYANNVVLADRRARSLIDFLSDGNRKLLKNLQLSSVAEDYDYLLELMREANDPDTAVIGPMIEKNTDIAKLKKQMQNYDNGRLWNRLLHTYFPELRAARIVVFFKHHLPRVRPLYMPEETEFSFWELDSLTEIVRPDLHQYREGEIPRRHLLALSTNLLEDAFYMPNFGWAPMLNIGVEFFPKKGNWSFKASFMSPYYHKWSKHKFFQIRDYHLEVRRWFKPGNEHTGLYLGAYVNAAKYGIGLSEKKGWQGEGAGAALKLGYAVRLANRWRIEFHAAAGCFITRFDPYVWGNPVSGVIDDKYYYDYTGSASDFHKRNHRFSWMGPTEVGITISYDLLFHRIMKRGASMRSAEKVRWEL